MTHSAYTNLLPPERRRRIRRDYFLRLAVVALIAATCLVAAYAALMTPTYLYLSRSAVTKRAHLASVESSLAASNEAQLSARLTALSNDAATLSALSQTTSVAALMRTVLAVARPGVALSGFSYTPAAGKTPGALSVSGVADTRDALQQYQMALESAPFVSAVDLPVSAYAKDTNIPFELSLTLAP